MEPCRILGCAMKTLLAVAVLFGSTIGVVATELDSDSQSYIDAKQAVTERVRPKGVQTRPYAVRDVDTRRFDEGPALRKADPLRPGFRNQAGMYVPPDYSTHPRGAGHDGFGSSAEPGSYGSARSPNPFVGTLGTRR